MQEFRRNPGLGLVAVGSHFPPLEHSWGGNEGNVRALAARLGIANIDTASAQFPAGTMFWARLRALDDLLDATLPETEFEPETGQIDGTLAHAVERLIGVCVQAGGYQIATSSQIETR
jgi:lipopolysaccharide biosynthesis protein